METLPVARIHNANEVGGAQEPPLRIEVVSRLLAMLRRFARKLGPYVMLEILLPGGTLLALLLFLYRRRLPLKLLRST